MALGIVKFGLLGPVKVEVDGERLRLTGKQRTLLALLLLHANRPVSVGRIIDALWDGHPPHSAPARVRALVSELRRSTGERGRELFVTQSPGYLVSVGKDELDADRFQELVERARASYAENELTSAVADYTAALGMWYGPALADVSSRYIEGARRQLVERNISAVEDRAEARIKLGAFRQAIADLQSLIAEHPLRERPRGQLMTALSRSGRSAEALEIYSKFRAYLVDELGVEPTAELRSIHQRILEGDPVSRARVMKRGDSTAVPGSAASSVPRLLPPAIGNFVGRETHFEKLDALSFSSSRVLLVVGAAGAGKTSLAVQWARKQTQRFPDGQLFLEMRGFDTSERPMTPSEALPMMLRALGTPVAEISHDLQRQVQQYRSLTADRSILVLLDDVSAPDQVRPLIPSGPSCLTLVTSRVRQPGLVAMNGASQVELDVLTRDEALEVLRRGAGHSRVQADEEAAYRVVEQCGRLPLALAIAAAKLADQQHRSLQEYAAELDQRGRLARLRIEGDETAAVQAALDLSYNALSSSARNLFRLFGLLPQSGVTLKAAAALLEAPVTETEDLLASIARVHLISTRSAQRYTCHDLVQEYAADRVVGEVGAEERACAIHRLYDYYLRSVMEVTRVAGLEELTLPYEPGASSFEPETFNSPTEAYEWVDGVWEDLAALIAQAAEGTVRPMSWLLMNALQDVLNHRRPLSEWVRLGELVLAGARAEGDSIGEAAANLSLGHARWRMADLRSAREHFDRAKELSHSARWRMGEAQALRGGGVVRKQVGDPRGSVPMHEAAIASYRSLGEKRGESICLNNLASAYLTLAELQPAQENLELVLPLVRQTKNHNLEAITLVNLGLVRQERGQLDSAHEVLHEALTLADRQGFTYAVAVAHETLGRVHKEAGQWGRATESFKEALALAVRVENRNCQVDALAGLAAVEGDRDEVAAQYLQRALDIARHTGHHTGLIDISLSSAEVHRRAGRLNMAEEDATRALNLALDAGPLGVSRAHVAMTAVLVDQHRWTAAIDEGRRAVHSAEQTGQKLVQARALVCIGHAQKGSGEAVEAGRSWRSAHEIFVKAGARDREMTEALLRSDEIVQDLNSSRADR